MKLNRLITFRSLATRRLRSALTLFGIILGVAAIFSIQFTNQNAYRSITRLFENTSGRVSLEVRSAANVGLPADLLDQVQDTSGVALAVPLLKLPASLPGDTADQMDLNFFGAGSGGLLLYGIDLQKDLEVRDYRITQGHFPEPAAERFQVAFVEDFARENDIEVGQTIRLLTANGLVEMDVVGFLAKEGAGLNNLGKFGVLDLAAAQILAKREGEIDQIDLVAESGQDDPASLTELRSTLAARLGEKYVVVSPASQGDRMAQMLSGYQIGLNFMAGIALFVGAFLIYNAFSMTVAERTRELGLLRSIGMTRGQVTAQIISEGLILGLIGSAAGAGLGIVMAKGLTALMSQVLGQPLDSGQIPFAVLAASMAVGVFATLFSAFLPAFQAGRISPLEILRLRSRSGGQWLLRYGWIAGSALLVLSTGILVWNPFPYDVQFRLGSLTVFALFLGAMLIIPITLKAWQWVCRWPLRLIFGSLGEIGSRNLERSRNRTMLTCAALLVGVSMIVVTQGMIGSFSADLYVWMDAYAGGDIFVGAAVPLTRELKSKLESLPGVGTAAPVRYLDITWLRDGTDEKISFMAIDPVSHAAVTHFIFSEEGVDPGAVNAELQQGRAILISSVLSEKYGLQQGDTLLVRTRDQTLPFKVAAVVLDFYNQGLVVTGSLDDLDRYFGVNTVSTFFIKADEGSAIPDVMREIENAYQESYQLIIESNTSIKARANDLMRQAFSMFDVLGILAVLVAALGVFNTLTMSVLERTREIGMLRSMGMTRYQVVRMILAEAGLLGLIGGVLGLGFGLALTRIFLAAMGAMSGYDLDFVWPVRAMWLSPAAALLISQLTALIPAVRAARTPVLTAIHYE